jgi:hypothetical protein
MQSIIVNAIVISLGSSNPAMPKVKHTAKEKHIKKQGQTCSQHSTSSCYSKDNDHLYKIDTKRIKNEFRK